ncbi:MAG: putative inorganic carbon transporter subunit DabA, partial [Chloroflexus sp.]
MTLVETNIQLLGIAAPSRKLTAEAIIAAAKRAEYQIAPLWPLRTFVAVNPYLGLIDHSFADAAQLLARRAGAKMTAPRSFYAEAIQSGRITDDDLAAAIASGVPFPGAPATVAALKAFAFSRVPEPLIETLPTVADVAAKLTGTPWAAIVTDSISNWAGAD